jgi:nicotinamidase/pyrazinamidase
LALGLQRIGYQRQSTPGNPNADAAMSAIDPARTALIVVDMQPDFMPGGPLPVAGAEDHGERLVAPVRGLMESDLLPLQVATQDWHPPGHVSFASSHPGRAPFDGIEVHGYPQTLWPDHCVQGSPGAELHPRLPLARLAAILRKGMDAQADSYSGFHNNHGPNGARAPTGLAGYLRERGVVAVVCCGLARDFCVKWTAEDAAAAGFTSYVLWDLCWPVHPHSDARVRDEIQARGVHLLDRAALADAVAMSGGA